MPQSDDERIADLEARLRLDDPRFAHGFGRGRPRRPREYRRGRAWLAMALALTAVVVGAVLPHGLLLAAGLVAAACAVNLFDTSRRRHLRPPRS
ncbi:DUF3040 domain-containing protein [Streptomyces sp. ActVer]|uniref:DUF3040 domain-containing protein n=1 Tax=Streptomyces sp. ActVer TaxID=3014558 RepID=UPI0022B31CD7|nr:DUF3040 domain-containing protein [Streptomyces sp. ActVer]MCZ4513926.1 DUF3040 domain-containing protein [Streptomyces sp. ActVer]